MTYDEFLKAAAERLDLNWRKYRRRSARRNLQERISGLGLPGYGEYLRYLDENPQEMERLPNLLRVTVSRFFRERDCWDELGRKLLPAFLNNSDGKPFSAWSVGCCNGEEPYSLSMLIISLLDSWPGQARPRIEILATDIDQTVLDRARAGCYERGSLREVPEEVLGRYFVDGAGRKCVTERVRAHVSFRLHDFMIDPLPSGVDLVICRYLFFTYFRGELRYRAARRLMDALAPGGILMVGRKDRLGLRERQLFEPVPGVGEVFWRIRREPPATPD